MTKPTEHWPVPSDRDITSKMVQHLWSAGLITAGTFADMSTALAIPKLANPQAPVQGDEELRQHFMQLAAEFDAPFARCKDTDRPPSQQFPDARAQIADEMMHYIRQHDVVLVSQTEQAFAQRVLDKGPRRMTVERALDAGWIDDENIAYNQAIDEYSKVIRDEAGL